jgi:predicted O-methyltransferase YrrM
MLSDIVYKCQLANNSLAVTSRRSAFRYKPMIMPSPQDVDAYFETTLLPPDAILTQTLAKSDVAGLPTHAVSPLQGQFLHILIKALGAKRVLEIGTLGGYSTICMARALPHDGALLSLEFDPICVKVARENIASAGLEPIVKIVEGAAIESLAALVKGDTAPFDIIFIDADKPNNPAYLQYALELSRVGTLIIGDNVVRDGAVADSASEDPKVQGVRTFLEATGQNRRLIATALQTVGSKGHDGFSLALVV